MRSQVWEELKEGRSKQREQQVQKPTGAGAFGEENVTQRAGHGRRLTGAKTGG